MILSASQYTDIPMCFADWFENKIQNGYFCIPDEKYNNIYKMTPENFELIIFQTKNPKNFIKVLPLLEEKGFKYYFLYTITPYNNDVEKNIGNKREILKTFKTLSNTIGSKCVSWKYGPIIINQTYDIEFHKKSFEALCKTLQGYTNECVINFIKEFIPPIHANLYTSEINIQDKKYLINEFYKISKKYNISLYCNEKEHSINDVKTSNILIRRKLKLISNINLNSKIKMLDVGIKNTCIGNCEYCTCGGNNNKLCNNNYNQNIIASSVLIGEADKKLPTKRPKISRFIDK